jgi:hypothetical protein
MNQSPDASSRGPASDALLAVLRAEPASVTVAAHDALRAAVRIALSRTRDVLHDEDLQLSLFLLYSLHYGGVIDPAGGWEWNPNLLGARAEIEHAFERALRAHIEVPRVRVTDAESMATVLFELTKDDGGPSLSRYVARSATLDNLRELLVQRSIYTLKEADPHSWAIPRLSGRAKVALVEIQSDEYGGGRPQRMHASIFGVAMRQLELDDRYGAYLDLVPAITLASFNMMSMFGLNRRLRGAIVGHLAAFEMTSSIPNRLYGNGFRRLGLSSEATWYFDEHVEADAVHEQIAARDLAGSLAEDEPALVDDILFGAAACLAIDGRVAQHMLDSWATGQSSLLRPLPSPESARR